VAALGNNLPEMIRAQNNIAPGISVTAGNAAAVPPLSGGANLPMPFPLNSTSNPPLFVPGDGTTPPSGLLSTLTPLAFISQSSGTTAQPTQLYDTAADTFLYAVGVSVGGLGFVGPSGLTDPDMVYFFYDDTSRILNFNGQIGQIVAKFSFQLTVLNTDFTERAVPTTLQITATAAGDCSASNVVGDFKGSGKLQTLLANTIGINCAVVSSPSPTLSTNHAIFEVAVPALITGACINPSPVCPGVETPPGPNTDPAYFYTLHHPGPPVLTNPINTGVFTAFIFDDPGTTPSKSGTLGKLGSAIGLAPSAPPFCTTTTCPTGSTPPPPGSITFALCASLPNNSATLTLRPAVGAYGAMATSGEMFLSAPLPSAFTSGGTPLTPPVCPSL
jgi:hypothetical protein